MGINLIKVVQPDNLIIYTIQNNKYFIAYNSRFYPFNYDCHSYHHDYPIFECKSKEFVINYLLHLKFIKFECNKITIFDIQIYTNHWKKFAKNKRLKRIALKLLGATAPHLGNPRFIDFTLLKPSSVE
jgi:hypothetical protein